MKDKTKGFLILVAVFLITVAILGNYTCKLKVKDAQTGAFVPDPNITVVPGLTQIGAPGTGGAGPMVYAITIPRFVNVTAKTYGYKEKSVTVLMFPWRSYDILLEKDLSSPSLRKIVDERTMVQQEKSDLAMIEKKFTSLNELFDAYHEKLDGAYAEGYAAHLYDLYLQFGCNEFIKVLGTYPQNKVKNITDLLVGEMYFRPNRDVYQNEIEKISTNPNLNVNERYVIKQMLDQFNYLEKVNENSVSTKVTKGPRLALFLLFT